MKEIYRQYKERLIKISGRNRSLFMKNIIKKYSYDIGKILEITQDTDPFYEFLWHTKREFNLINDKICAKITTKLAKNTEEKGVNLNKLQSENFSQKELSDLKYLKREVDELEKETGRYELFIGFPFIIGNINAEIPLKAPLMLFPATLDIEKDEAILRLIPNQPVMLNKTFILAYSKEHSIKTDNLLQEFEPTAEDSFATPYDVMDYLIKNGFKLKYQKRKNIASFELPIDYKPDGLEIKNMAVLGRFPLANSIYNDYLALEKDDLSSPSIEMLVTGKKPILPITPIKKFLFKKKPIIEQPIIYPINSLDYAQENAIEQINREDNIVIYGPPGTGKSQTIVNIISDALCKNKRVLVVSQKRAALDVVFSRLGRLSTKAMLLPDPEKNKMAFYERLRETHITSASSKCDSNITKYLSMESNINNEISILKDISETLFTKTEFGLTLQEMYAESYNIGKDSKDYLFYNQLKDSTLIDKNYKELDYDVKLIKDKSLIKLYFNQLQLINDNPMVVHILPDLDMHKLKEAITFINKVLNRNITPFDVTKYPYSRYLITFYLENTVPTRKNVKKVADIVTRIENQRLTRCLNWSLFPLFLPAFPFLKTKFNNIRENITIDLNIAKNSLLEYEKDYAILSNVLDKEGYALAIGGLINGNTSLLQKLLTSLENYVEVRDTNIALKELSQSTKDILDFAYDYSDKSISSFKSVVDKIIPVRIYHEIIKNDKYIEGVLSKTVTFDELRERILSLKAKKGELTFKIALDRYNQQYKDILNSDEKSKDYLYNINKQRALWSIRRLVEIFESHLLTLFPCWLLSPEVVSTILPLKKDLFDLVVFDEASQVYIEAALPAIYRGTRCVVAGDNRQLRPTSGFVKRYLGDDSFDYNMDLSTQAALEVESLLDLATAKYSPVNLTYHYRSKYAELIDFSNIVFYENRLQIAPNILKSGTTQPIERIKVKGTWQNRHNHEEAMSIIKLLKTILKDRKEEETIGIVTFNIEQKEYIEDMIDAESDKSPSFRRQIANELNRYEDGENASLFVKNLENVQGDERDIIIFSIGYAKNEMDKVVAQFGSLSMEGGENRLNVAITRARKKIYVITSIEPEELDRAETTKNSGPKLLKKYLQYVRAVSEGNPKEIKDVLLSLSNRSKSISPIGAYEQQIKQELEALGYDVETNIGNTDYRLSLGVYDKDSGKFILGIECDYEAYRSSNSVLERDVYRFKFLESKGWHIVRVWSRDWWLSRRKVLENLVELIEKQKVSLSAKSLIS